MSKIKKKFLYFAIYLFKIGATTPHMNYYLFINNQGENAEGLNFHIFKYMLKKYPLRKYVWAFKTKQQVEAFKKQFPECQAILYNSMRLCFYLQKSRYWVINSLTPSYFKASKYTFYLQTSTDENIIKKEKKKFDYLLTYSEERKEELINTEQIEEKKIVVLESSNVPTTTLSAEDTNWDKLDEILCQ